MKVFSALLAEILVGAGVFIHNADTASMLPDFADVALDEQAARFVILDVRICHGKGLAIFGLDSIRWWTWVLLLTTDASCDLLLLRNVIVQIVLVFHRVVIVVIVVLAGSTSGQWWLYE